MTLTPTGTENLARFLGPRVYSADGTVASISPTGDPVVGVTWVQLVDGTRQPWSGEGVVTFPSSAVTAVSIRKLARPKTYMAAALIVIALGAIAVTSLKGGGGNIRDTPGDGNPLGLLAPSHRPH